LLQSTAFKICKWINNALFMCCSVYQQTERYIVLLKYSGILGTAMEAAVFIDTNSITQVLVLCWIAVTTLTPVCACV